VELGDTIFVAGGEFEVAGLSTGTASIAGKAVFVRSIAPGTAPAHGNRQLRLLGSIRSRRAGIRVVARGNPAGTGGDEPGDAFGNDTLCLASSSSLLMLCPQSDSSLAAIVGLTMYDDLGTPATSAC
jgi:hypothetical protein